MKTFRMIAFIALVGTTLPSAAVDSNHGTGAMRAGQGYFPTASGGSVGLSFAIWDGVYGGDVPPTAEAKSGGHTCINWRKGSLVAAYACGVATPQVDPALATATLQTSMSGFIYKFTRKVDCRGSTSYEIVGTPKRATLSVQASWLGSGEIQALSGQTNLGIARPDGQYTHAGVSSGNHASSDPNGPPPTAGGGTYSSGGTQTRPGGSSWDGISFSGGLARKATGSLSITVPGYGTTSGSLTWGSMYSVTGSSIDVDR